MCNIGLLIVNGRAGKDVNVGMCTCKGVSVVDYAIASPFIFSHLEFILVNLTSVFMMITYLST